MPSPPLILRALGARDVQGRLVPPSANLGWHHVSASGHEVTVFPMGEQVDIALVGRGGAHDAVVFSLPIGALVRMALWVVFRVWLVSLACGLRLTLWRWLVRRHTVRA